MFFHAYPHQYAGSQRVTHVLARELRDRGYEIRVVTPDDGPFVSRLRADRIDTQPVVAPTLWSRYGRGLEGPIMLSALAALPAYWLKLAREIRSWRPQLVHCNDHRGLLLAGPAVSFAGLPLVWHVHGAYDSVVINLLGGLLAARILVVSKATLDEMPLVRRFGGKVEVLANGLAPIRSAAKHLEPASPPRPGRHNVVCAARIHPDKGLEVLIRAAASLRERFPDLQVQIIGGVQPGYEQYAGLLEQLRDGLGLREVVHFRGYVNDPYSILDAASVYVQPSRVEPFGLAALEAMSLGVPVVVARVGGLREIVEHGISGLQTEADDPHALATAMGRILADRPYAERLGAAARIRAETGFSWEAMIARLLQIYREVLQQV